MSVDAGDFAGGGGGDSSLVSTEPENFATDSHWSTDNTISDESAKAGASGTYEPPASDPAQPPEPIAAAAEHLFTPADPAQPPEPVAAAAEHLFTPADPAQPPEPVAAVKDGAPEATTPSAPALEAESHVGEVLATVMTEVGAQAVEHGLEGGLLPKIAGEYAGGASVNVELLGGLYKNVALVGPAVGVIVDVVRGEDPSRIAVVNGSAAIGSVLAGSSGAVVGSWIGQTVYDDNQDPGLHPFILSGAIAGGTVGALGGLETAGAGAVAGALAGDLMGNVVRDDGNASMRPYIRGGAIAGAFLGSEGGPLGVLAGSFVGGVAGDIEARAVGHSGATTPPPLTDDEVPAVDNPNAD